MTKAELEQILILSGVECRTKRDLKIAVNCMVEAYNQAIDDSVELLDDNPEYDIQAVYKLKI